MFRVTEWSQIRPGAMWCVHGSAWISRAIRWVTGQDWNHCGWVIGMDAEKGPMTQEALKKIEINPLSNYRKEFDSGNLAVFMPDIPDAVLAVMLFKATSRLGTAYGWWSTLSLAWWVRINRIANLFGRQVTTPHRRHEKCSEECLVAALDGQLAADKLRVDVPDLEWSVAVPDKEMFTPGDLYARLNALIQKLFP